MPFASAPRVNIYFTKKRHTTICLANDIDSVCLIVLLCSYVRSPLAVPPQPYAAYAINFFL